MYQPERRIPFGFRGDWGTLYKRYTDNCELNLQNETISYEKYTYVDIGAAIQFKPVDNIDHTSEQNILGLLTNLTYLTLETTDAYWDEQTNNFVCCVDKGDIIKLFNRLWIVTEVRENPKYCPKKLSFYYCECKSIV